MYWNCKHNSPSFIFVGNSIVSFGLASTEGVVAIALVLLKSLKFNSEMVQMSGSSMQRFMFSGIIFF